MKYSGTRVRHSVFSIIQLKMETLNHGKKAVKRMIENELLLVNRIFECCHDGYPEIQSLSRKEII